MKRSVAWVHTILLASSTSSSASLYALYRCPKRGTRRNASHLRSTCGRPPCPPPALHSPPPPPLPRPFLLPSLFSGAMTFYFPSFDAFNPFVVRWAFFSRTIGILRTVGLSQTVGVSRTVGLSQTIPRLHTHGDRDPRRADQHPPRRGLARRTPNQQRPKRQGRDAHTHACTHKRQTLSRRSLRRSRPRRCFGETTIRTI